MDENEFVSAIIEISGKTVLSAIPIGGTLISSIWDSVKENALREREKEWKNLIEERISKLENTLEDIGNNEIFTSALLKASEIAAKTAETEKKEYLANAVVNSVQTELKENKIIIFLNLIDKYTSWHIRLLDFFRNPPAKGAKVGNYVMGSPLIHIQRLFPEICAEEGLVDKIIQDLQNDGLVQRGDFIHVTMSAEGMVASRTTKLGNEFLDYVEE